MAESKPRKCSIDRDPEKMDWVARRHLEGFTPTKMEELAKAQGRPIKRETIARHLKQCIGVGDVKPKEVKALAEALPPPKVSAQSDDVAVLVQKKVVEKLQAGDARVTVQHGLQAQQLLDRRAERAKDRELAVTLARLLHTGGPPPSAVTARPVDVIEGEVVAEVTSGQ